MAEQIPEPQPIRQTELQPDHVAQSTLIRVGQLQEGVCHLRKKVGKLEESINGNGKDGLLVRVDRLEQTDERQEGIETRVDRLEQSDRRRVWIERIVIGAAILVFVNTVFDVVRDFTVRDAQHKTARQVRAAE